MTVKICKAGPADTAKISEIEARSFPSPWSFDGIVSTMSSPSVVTLKVTDECGNIVGYAFVSVVCDQAELINIAVDSSYRKCGIGLALAENALLTAKECGAAEIFLEVRETNTAARNLYEKIGFTQIGVRKKYYANPTEDAVLMKKLLLSPEEIII